MSNFKLMALLALLSVAIEGAGAFDHDELRVLEATARQPVADEVKIQAVSQKQAQSAGTVNQARTKEEFLKVQSEEQEVVLLLTLISIFGMLFLAMIVSISVYVYRDRQEQARLKATKPEANLEMKNVQAASKDLLVSKLQKIKKSSSEEGAKLIKNPMSNRPSDLTAASNDDLNCSTQSSATMRNLDNPFTVKKFKNQSSIGDDEEKAKSSPSKQTPPNVTGPKMMRVNTTRDLTTNQPKYDRKEVKGPQTPAAARSKMAGAKRTGWK